MRVFIGSSNEAVERGTLGELEAWIDDFGHEPVPWNRTQFQLGDVVYSRLIELASEVDAAILIFGPDDKLWYRGNEKTFPRDNVLLEYGLFLGALGQHNVVAAIESNAKKPSDLAGVVHLVIDPENSGARARLDLRRWLDDAERRRKEERKPRFLSLENGIDQLRGVTHGLLTPIEHEDHPLVRFLEAWYSELTQELEEGGSNAFEFDPSYYRACLSHLNSGIHQKQLEVFAVADLSVRIEDFWKTTPPRDVQASSRVFLMSPEQFFDDDKLAETSLMLRKHAAVYPVFLTLLSIVEGPTPPFRDSPGKDMLLVGPDVIAGYGATRVGSPLRLKIERNTEGYRDLYEIFGQLKRQSVQVFETETSEQIREKWIKKSKAGIWRKSWNTGRVASRSTQYFSRYDVNVRCWITPYDELIRKCGKRVRDLARRKLRANDWKTFSVLEIGYGSGALTLEVIRSLAPHERKALLYFGVDEAKQRFRGALEKKLGAASITAADVTLEDEKIYFDREWKLPQRTLSASPFDAIIGSLVLHDIVSGNPEMKFRSLLERCSGYLQVRGSLIFADVFTSPNDRRRAHQVEKWCEAMRLRGLKGVERNKDLAEWFVENNYDMVETLNEETLDRVCKDCGFSFERIDYVGDPWSPFGVLVLTKETS